MCLKTLKMKNISLEKYESISVIIAPHSYNPCTPLHGCDGELEGVDVAVCKYLDGDTKRIGQQSRARFISGSSADEIAIEYSNTDPLFFTKTTSLVTLRCDLRESAGRLEFVRDRGTTVEFRFYTRQACAPKQPTSGINNIEIAVIIFLVLSLSAAVGFYIYVFVYKPEGEGDQSVSPMFEGTLTAAEFFERTQIGIGWVPHRIIPTPTSSPETTRRPATVSASLQPQPTYAGQNGPEVVDTLHPADRTRPLTVSIAGLHSHQVALGFDFALPSYDAVLLMKELESRPAGAYVITTSQHTELSNPSEEND